jgi:hypothetical protein
MVPTLTKSKTLKLEILGLPGRHRSPLLIEEVKAANVADIFSAIVGYGLYRLEPRTAYADLLKNRILVRDLSAIEIAKYSL